MTSPCCFTTAAALVVCSLLLIRRAGSGVPPRAARRRDHGRAQPVRPRIGDDARAQLLAKLRQEEARQRPQEGRN